MIKVIKIVLQRILITLIYHAIQILDYKAGIIGITGHSNSILIYGSVVITLSVIEILLIEDIIETPDKYKKLLLDAIYVVTVIIGLAANIYNVHHALSLIKPDVWEYWFRYAVSPLLGLTFELIIRVVLGIKIKKLP
ncbi:MAG TPA: hypothetical protein VIM55_17100 [Mucilaginibacter sp.]